MRTLIIILLTASLAWSTTETLRPDSADVIIQGDWTANPEASAYVNLGDNNDATYMTMYDNNSIDSNIIVCMENPSTSDSTIDSVIFYIRWRTDNISDQPGLIDTTDGETLNETPFSTATTNTWITDSTTRIELPSKVAYNLSKLTSTMLGVSAYAMGNNKTLDVADLWAVVFSHAEGAGGDISYTRRRKEIIKHLGE